MDLCSPQLHIYCYILYHWCIYGGDKRKADTRLLARDGSATWSCRSSDPPRLVRRVRPGYRKGGKGGLERWNLNENYVCVRVCVV